MASVASLLDELRETTVTRIEHVETAQSRHEDRVDARLLRYEDSQREQTNRIIKALEGVAALETVPAKLTEIEKDLRGIKDRLTSVETSLEVGDARASGRSDIFQGLMTWGKFAVEHGWKVAVVAYFLVDAGAKYLHANSPRLGDDLRGVAQEQVWAPE